MTDCLEARGKGNGRCQAQPARQLLSAAAENRRAGFADYFRWVESTAPPVGSHTRS